MANKFRQLCRLVAGIDIAKDWLDICVRSGARVACIVNNADAVGAWLDRVVPGLVGFELVITANTIARDRQPWRGRRETARTSSPA